MSASENRKMVEKWYTALSEGDFDSMMAMHPDDVVFNLFGNTPLSGRFVGKDLVFGEIVSKYVVGALKAETIKFAKKWRIMAADDNCVVGLMQGGGMGKNGLEYNQTYCQIFTIQGDQIVEMHELFDTVLVEKVLFSNPLQNTRTASKHPFGF